MKRIALGLLGLLAASVAPAADLSIPAPVYGKAPTAIAAPTWDGCFAAMEAGGLTGANQTGSPTAGGMLGCNWQSGVLVYGFEGSADAAKTSKAPAPGTVDVSALGHVAGRIGYAYQPAAPVVLGPITVPAALFYLKAAVPMQYINPSSKVETGYGAAGGVEIPIKPYMTIGYEYRFNRVQSTNDHGFFTVWRIYYEGT